MASYYGSSGFRTKSKVGFILLIGLLGGLILQSGCAGLAGPSQSSGGGTQSLSVSGTSAGNVTQSSATVGWQTNLPATSQIEYGTSVSYGATTALDASLVTNHQQGMSGLKSATLYHFRVHSKDANNNEAVSADMSVTTAAAPDTTAPTVSISSPAPNATLSGTVSVTATASDNVGVAGVQFKADGNNIGAEDASSPYSASLNTATLSNGNHTLTAIARDAAGNTTTSTGVTVNVSNTAPDTTAPAVSITAPAPGSTVSGTISVSATASDNVGVAGVQFRLDGNNLGAEDTSSPYSISWNTTAASNGSHSLTAVARDAAGNRTTSAAVTVTVNNTPTADTTAPSVPSGLSAIAASSSQLNLTWNASTDNVAVAGYKIFRGGSQIATSSTTSYSDTGLSPSTSYSYAVAAYDAAGNTSVQSANATATTFAFSGGGIPTALGWYQIPNTKMAPLCPSGVAGVEGCGAVISTWNGGVADTKRNRLLFLGGGHSAYAGNEVYALDLNSLAMTRLTNPSTSDEDCSETYADGNPASRHTYGGLAYIASADKLFMHGGALYPCGQGSVATWTFDEGTLKWTRKDPTSGTQIAKDCCNYINFSAYDAVTDKVYLFDDINYWKYDHATNSYTPIGNQQGVDYHVNAVIDEGRRLFLMFGAGQVWSADLSTNGVPVNISAQVSGCAPIQNPDYPGLAYDPVQKLVIGWAGGNTVYAFNAGTKSCTAITYPNGPGAAQANGTFGRFRYFPSLGVFALVNDWQQNAYTLRLTAPSGGSAEPIISSVAAASITTSGATITWTSDVGSTSQVEYGTTTAYASLTTMNTSLVTAHSVALTGLSAGTLYHYRVHSKNSAGVESISSDFAFSTNNTTDTTLPTVSISSPAANATVSGTVTVSASASDNVGVISVQFLLDGANLGSAVTLSPYSVSWNTTTATNGAHTLAAQASDAAGNVGNAVGVIVNASNSTSTALQDFQARCGTTGVIVCKGFDSASEFTPATWPNSGVYPADDGQFRVTMDTAVLASGNGSARFFIPANDTITGGNISGNWMQRMGRSFGAHTTFYVQYRFRVDTAMQSTNWEDPAMGGSSPKIAIFHNVGATCASEELTTNNRNGTSMPMMYTDCGSRILGAVPGTTLWTSQTPPYQWQNGYYNCAYDVVPSPPGGCFTMPANTWITFYYRVSIGDWGQPNSQITAWLAPDGQTLQKFIDITNMTLFQDGTNEFDSVTLLNYMTAFGQTQPPRNPAANSWYDELIVSTAPVPAPAGQGPTPQ